MYRCLNIAVMNLNVLGPEYQIILFYDLKTSLTKLLQITHFWEM